MGQAQLLEYLTKHRGQKFTVKELRRRLGWGYNPVGFGIAKLHRYGMVEVEIKPMRQTYRMNGKTYITHHPIKRVWVK